MNIIQKPTFDTAVHDEATLLARKFYGDRAVIRWRDNMWWVDPRTQTFIGKSGLAAGALEKLLTQLRDLCAANPDGSIHLHAKEYVVTSTNTLYTSKQAAKYLGWNATTLAQWARTGKAKATLVPGPGRNGKQYRYAQDELDRLKAEPKPHVGGNRWKNANSRKPAKKGTIRRRAVPGRAEELGQLGAKLTTQQEKRLKALRAALNNSGNPLLRAAAANPFDLIRSAIDAGLDQLEKGVK